MIATIRSSERLTLIGRPVLERRRSYRIPLGPHVSIHVEDLEPASISVLSLGGVTIETARKPSLGACYTLQIDYGRSSARLEIRVDRSSLQELYYSDSGHSRVRYLVGARFLNPDIPALNVLYRIMKDHWIPDAIAEE